VTADARFSAWTLVHPRPRRFWTAFLHNLARRGLCGVKLISDAHEGIKGAVAKVLHATWQCCRMHFMRNAPARAGKSGRRVLFAFIATAFAQDDADAAKALWRRVADQLRLKLPKLAAFLDEAEADGLAYGTFPAPSCTRPSRSSVSTARSSARPRWSASSPTRTPLSGSSAPSYSNRTMNGRSSAPAT
jgi:transposase-like protein